MKRELIAGLVASVLLGQVPNVETKNVEVASAKARIASIGNLSISREMMLKGKEVYEIDLKAEQLRLEAEEKARKEEEARIAAEEARKAEEARQAEELKLELARQASVGFDDMDVTRLSNMTAYELQNVLYNMSKGDIMAQYASYFIEAEQMYGINALFICSIASHESGWGYYAAGGGTNLTGYAVYNSSSEGATFEGGIRHNILETARLIAEDYVNPQGRYHTEWDGYNYGKSIYEINVRYCLYDDMVTTDFGWSKSIGDIANDLVNKYHELRQ